MKLILPALLLMMCGCKSTPLVTNSSGTYIVIEHHHLRDLPNGKVGHTSVFFAQDGGAFIWLDSDDKSGAPDAVWQKDGKWFGDLAWDIPPDRVPQSELTGYWTISAAGGTPITLVSPSSTGGTK